MVVKYVLLICFCLSIPLVGIAQDKACNVKEKSALLGYENSKKFVTQKDVLLFKTKIVPWLETKFKEDISDEICAVERKLIFKDLMRAEFWDNKEQYLVHIEFTHTTSDKTSDIKIHSTSGQEIIFWIEDEKIKDFFPFDEYVIHQTIEGSGEYEDSI